MRMTITNDDGSIKEYSDIIVYAFWIKADFKEIIDAYIDTSALSAKGYKDFVEAVIKDVCEHSLWPDVGTIRKSAIAIFNDNDFEKKGFQQSGKIGLGFAKDINVPSKVESNK